MTREGQAGTATTVLRVDGLHYHAGPRPLFQDWSIGIGRGVTLVQGGEGSGKSSLLRLFAGRLAPDAGSLSLGGITLSEQPTAYRRQLFLADPDDDTFDQITPLVYLHRLQQQHDEFKPDMVGDLLDGLSLSDHRDKPLFMLSTGSRRKVWLAGAFASGAALTLLDQPFAALDRRSIDVVLELLTRAARHRSRAWVLADYEPPPGVPLAQVIDLG